MRVTTTKGDKSRGKERKFLEYILGDSYFCDEHGHFVTLEQISNPKYNPWVKCCVTIKDKRKKNTIYKYPARAFNNTFYYHYETNRLYREPSKESKWVKLKSNKKRWKKLIEQILSKEPQIWKKKDPSLLGYKGKSTLSTGYVYAPYIPIMVTPTILTNNFSMRKSIRMRYAKKFI